MVVKKVETMQLILAKMNSPVETPRLSRERLLAMLRTSITSCASTIISGRAGTGKTLLAADFAGRCGRRVAWYKVDHSDTRLQVFLNYLVASIRAQRPGFGLQILSNLEQAAALDDTPLLAELLVHELLESGGEPLLIVIDDLHLVYDAAWTVPFFRRLFPLLPAEAHLLITGRGLPPSPLWRMRSKQSLAVLEEGVLDFTADEARALFASYGLGEGPATVALKRTRGRAAALDMAARTINTPGGPYRGDSSRETAYA